MMKRTIVAACPALLMNAANRFSAAPVITGPAFNLTTNTAYPSGYRCIAAPSGFEPKA